MEQIEIIERIMNVTHDWSVTLNLLEKYPIRTPERISPQPLEALPAPKKEPERIELVREVTADRKKFKIKKGKLSEQLMEALSCFPNSTVEELLNLTGREMDDRSTVSTACRKLCDKKVLVRSKNDRGLFAYRLAAAPH